MAANASHLRPRTDSAGQATVGSGVGEAVVLIYPIATLSTEIERQIAEVCDVTGMDAYTIRQKLTGSSIDVLSAGSDIPRLEKITRSLINAGYRAALISKNELSADNSYCRAVSARFDNGSAGPVTFYDTNGSEVYRWNGRSRLLLVAGSLAPEQYGVSRRLIASLYGATPDESQVQNNRLAHISKNHPGLALISADDNSPLVIDGGMFNYECLGNRKSYSQAQNYLTLVEILQNSAGPDNTLLDPDFGVKRLPVGRLASNPRSKNDTIKLLATYSRLIALVDKQGFFSNPKHSQTAESTEGVAAPHSTVSAPLSSVGLNAKQVMPTQHPTQQPTQQSTQRTAPNTAAHPSSPLPPPPPAPPRHVGDLFSLSGIVTYLGEFSNLGLIAALIMVTIYLGFTSPKPDSAFMFNLLGVMLGVMYGVVALILMKRRGAISRLATSRIRSMPMGVVEVNGTAVQKYALKAPHSLADCIYYNYRVMERTSRKVASGAETESWRVINHGNSGHVPFYIEDDTGKVLVNPHGAVISGAQTEEYTSSFAEMLSGVSSPSNRKIIETIIPAGTELYVIGYARPNTPAPGERREAYRQRLKAMKTDPAIVAQYDSDGDGTISFEEWAVAKADLDNKLLAERISSEEQSDKVVIERHPGNGVFFISNKKESDILSSYRWKVPLFGVLGFGLIIKGLWELLGK